MALAVLLRVLIAAALLAGVAAVLGHVAGRLVRFLDRWCDLVLLGALCFLALAVALPR